MKKNKLLATWFVTTLLLSSIWSVWAEYYTWGSKCFDETNWTYIEWCKETKMNNSDWIQTLSMEKSNPLFIYDKELDDGTILKPIYIFIQNENSNKSWIDYNIDIKLDTEKIEIAKEVFLEWNDTNNDILDIDEVEWMILLSGKIAWHIDWWVIMIEDNWLENIIINWEDVDFNETTRFKTEDNIEVIITKWLNEDTKKILEYYKNEINEKREEYKSEVKEFISEKREEYKDIFSKYKEDAEELYQKYASEYKILEAKFYEEWITEEEKEELKKTLVELKKKYREVRDNILKDKKENVSELKAEIKEKRENYKDKYKKVFKNKYEKTIKKISTDKLKLINEKIDKLVEKYEANNSLSDDKKAMLLWQLDALKNLIDDVLLEENNPEINEIMDMLNQ